MEVKKNSPHDPLKNAGKLCETRKSKMAAVAILKKLLFIKSFKTDIFFYIFGVREHEFGTIFTIRGQVCPQMQNKGNYFNFLPKIRHFLKRQYLRSSNL